MQPKLFVMSQLILIVAMANWLIKSVSLSPHHCISNETKKKRKTALVLVVFLPQNCVNTRFRD